LPNLIVALGGLRACVSLSAGCRPAQPELMNVNDCAKYGWPRNHRALRCEKSIRAIHDLREEGRNEN